MSQYRVGFIGTGLRRHRDGSTGFGMNAAHARGYRQLGDTCTLVACCDIEEARAAAFAEEFDIERAYVDYKEMLQGEDLDIVSISTWPHLHAEMTIECAEAGVQAIHCEKPMAITWGNARRMAEACAERGVRLTFNHQRRFGKPFRGAKRLLDDGRIGALRKLEFACSNLYDWGTHCFDMAGYFSDQTPVEWVMAQVDYTSERRIFGAHNENAGIALWSYESGVFGHCCTGQASGAVGAFFRLTGTDGAIEISPAGEDMPVLRYRTTEDAGWNAVDCEGEGVSDPSYVGRAIADVVRALEEGGTSELCAENALQTTEIIFACYESVRRRGRVALPLEIDDNPLVAMVESGELTPAPRE